MTSRVACPEDKAFFDIDFLFPFSYEYMSLEIPPLLLLSHSGMEASVTQLEPQVFQVPIIKKSFFSPVNLFYIILIIRWPKELRVEWGEHVFLS